MRHYNRHELKLMIEDLTAPQLARLDSLIYERIGMEPGSLSSSALNIARIDQTEQDPLLIELAMDSDKLGDLDKKVRRIGEQEAIDESGTLPPPNTPSKEDLAWNETHYEAQKLAREKDPWNQLSPRGQKAIDHYLANLEKAGAGFLDRHGKPLSREASRREFLDSFGDMVPDLIEQSHDRLSDFYQPVWEELTPIEQLQIDLILRHIDDDTAELKKLHHEFGTPAGAKLAKSGYYTDADWQTARDALLERNDGILDFLEAERNNPASPFRVTPGKQGLYVNSITNEGPVAAFQQLKGKI